MEPRIDKLVSIFNHKLRTELNFQYEKIGLSDKNYFYLERSPRLLGSVKLNSSRYYTVIKALLPARSIN